LARGEIDFLIMLEEKNARPEFRTVTSIYQPLVFLTYPNNPILENGSLSLAEIVDNQVIVADREIGYSALLERQLRQEGIPFHPVMEMGSVDAILQVLLGGYGITIVPAFAASTYLESGQLVSIGCEEISFDMYANYICSKDRWMSPVMKEFVKVVEEYA
jgi:DNA-binding transcriptional LysR family regulator